MNAARSQAEDAHTVLELYVWLSQVPASVALLPRSIDKLHSTSKELLYPSIILKLFKGNLIIGTHNGFCSWFRQRAQSRLPVFALKHTPSRVQRLGNDLFPDADLARTVREGVPPGPTKRTAEFL